MKNKFFLLSIILFLTLGLSAQTYLISDGGTINTCTGTLYDSGGPTGTYQNNEYYTITICSDQSSTVVLDFIVFDTESGFDGLTVYDGSGTGGDILAGPDADGNELQGDEIESTETCITLVWDSDGSVNSYDGFEIDISCGIECQDWDIDAVSTSPGFTNADSAWVDICLGETVTFTAEGVYPNNNQNYSQSDATTTWYWEILNNEGTEEISGQGLNELVHQFDEPGGFFIHLHAEDVNGCAAYFEEEYRVRVSIPPDIINLEAQPTTVCPGDTVYLSGEATTNSWQMQVTNTQVVQECITDDQGVTQNFCWNVNAFEPGQTITDADQFESVCMNIEHSFIADLWIYIQCPNGQQAEINWYGTDNPCSGDYFGEPDHSDDCNPGVGYDYCWTMDASQSHTDWCDNVGGTVPSGDYLPTGTFDDLIGCPINGEWCVVVIDDWGADDGTIFTVNLNFSQSIIPADLWSIDMDIDNLEWSGDGILPNSGGTATAVPMTPGEQYYTFSVTDNFGCTYTDSVAITVLDYDDSSCCTMPNTYAGENDSVCTDTYVLQATLEAGNTGEWEVLDGPGNVTFTDITNPNATITVDQWGTYEFQFTEQNLTPACQDSATVTITFSQIPTSTFTITPIECNGDSTVITYTGNASPSATYDWSFDGGTVLEGSGQGPIEVAWDDTGTYTISLSVTEDGCSSGDTTVNINHPPELSFDLEVYDDPCYQSCNGGAQVTASGGAPPYEYLWGSNTNTIENLCAGTYGITVQDDNECEVVTTYTIEEPEELVITDTSFSDISCYAADDGEMHISAEGGTGVLTYTWSDGGTGPDRIDMPAGNYFVTVTDEHDCVETEMFQLTQPDQLQATISPDMAICEGQTISINSQQLGGTPPYTYYWDSGNGYVVDNNIISLTPDTTTTYTVYVEDAHGCESSPVSMTITVSPTMSVDLETQDNRCYNSCDGWAELYLQGGIEPFNYSWGSPTNVYNNICAGFYTVTISDQLGCSVDTMFFISEPDSLEAHISTLPASCNSYEDGMAVVSVNGGIQPYSYLWPEGTQNDTLLTDAGSYTVTITDAHDCRVYGQAVITEPEELELFTASDRWICKTQETTINAQAMGGTGYYDFEWVYHDSITYNEHQWTVSPMETTTYYVQATDENGCTSNVGSLTVNVYPELEIANVSTSYDSVCPGDPAIIIVDAQGGNGGPYELTLSNGQVVPSPFTVYPQETQTYYIELNDMCGTPSVQDSIEILVMSAPANDFVADRVEGCPPLRITFNEMSEEEDNEYLWSFGDHSFSHSKNPSHIYRSSGKYDVTLTVTSDFGCVTSHTIVDMVEIYEKPIADFYASPDVVSILDAEVHFTNLSEMADTSYWFFGDGDSSLFVNPHHMFDGIGEYEVQLVAENEEGCMDTASKTILVQDEFTFFAPTAFTPNGDGDNDYFMVYGNGIDPTVFSLKVYDRWGSLVFETDAYDPDSPSEHGWDGTMLGDRMSGDALLTIGVYSWYCKYKDWTGIWHEQSGLVRLIR